MLWGSSGNDTIVGGDGNDIIFGGAGNNRLSGDTILDNSGSDIFEYAKNVNAHDVITDFTTWKDKLHLFGAKSMSEVTFTTVPHAVGEVWDHLSVTWAGNSIELIGVDPMQVNYATSWIQLG